MNKTLLDQYESYKKQIRDAELWIENNKVAVMTEVKNNGTEDEKGVHRIGGQYGNFILTKTKTWQFSDNVQVANNNLKKLKEKEKKDGIATSIDNEIVIFVSFKEVKQPE